MMSHARQSDGPPYRLIRIAAIPTRPPPDVPRPGPARLAFHASGGPEPLAMRFLGAEFLSGRERSRKSTGIAPRNRKRAQNRRHSPRITAGDTLFATASAPPNAHGTSRDSGVGGDQPDLATAGYRRPRRLIEVQNGDDEVRQSRGRHPDPRGGSSWQRWGSGSPFEGGAGHPLAGSSTTVGGRARACLRTEGADSR
jgi:hypothetical protein